ERIEAWSDATNHGRQHGGDIRASQSTEANGALCGGAPHAIGSAARTLGAFGFGGMFAVDDVAPVVRSLYAGHEVKQHVQAEAAAAIAAAQASATADQAPSEADGAHVYAGSVEIAAAVDTVWPLLVRPDRYGEWMTALISVTVISGAGSDRVQKLRFSNDYAVQQRVTGLRPSQSISWRDDLDWTDLVVESAGSGSRVTFRVTRLTTLPDEMQRWVDSSLQNLASAAVSVDAR
ncbi:MAG: SRPBCC family protein, partial [Gaiellales bacterium]